MTLDRTIDNFAFRVVQDCLSEAMSRYWIRRAETLEGARWKPGDYTGRATPDEIAARDAKLTLAAQNCRSHAQLLAEGTVSPYDVPDTELALEAS